MLRQHYYFEYRDTDLVPVHKALNSWNGPYLPLEMTMRIVYFVKQMNVVERVLYEDAINCKELMHFDYIVFRSDLLETVATATTSRDYRSPLPALYPTGGVPMKLRMTLHLPTWLGAVAYDLAPFIFNPDDNREFSTILLEHRRLREVACERCLRAVTQVYDRSAARGLNLTGDVLIRYFKQLVIDFITNCRNEMFYRHLDELLNEL